MEIMTWMLVGNLVWFYYMNKNKDDYTERYLDGKLKGKDFLIGYVGTVLIWPLTIINQMRRR